MSAIFDSAVFDTSIFGGYAPVSTELVTLEVLLTTIGINTTNTVVRSRYDSLRTMVTQAVKTYVKWGINEVEGQVDYYDGLSYIDIPLRRPYVSTITSVYLDQTGFYGNGPSAFTGTALTNGQDYSLVMDDNTGGKSGLLRRLYNPLLWFPSDGIFSGMKSGLSYNSAPFWPKGIGNIKVTYSYGFATIPADIQMAVCTGVSIVANSTRYGFPLTSESLGAHNYSLSLQRDPEFGTVRQLLSRYRDLAV